MSMPEIRVTDHAREEARRRGIPGEVILDVARHPEQVVPGYGGREVRQSRVAFPPQNQLYLVRVITEMDGAAFRVVTVYRTSQIAKYWRST